MGGAGWAREPDGRFGENCLAPVGIRNPDYPARRLVAVPTTLSPPQMMDTNNKYEDQIHWILDESSKNKATHSERKERIDTSQFRNFHTNTEEIQILLAGKTGEPTAAAPALLLPITAFSHYKTRSINAECLTFKADCRIPFFFFQPCSAPRVLQPRCQLYRDGAGQPRSPLNKSCPIKSSAYTQSETSFRLSVLTHFWSAAHFGLYSYCMLKTEERILQTANSKNSSNFQYLPTCHVGE